MRIQSNPASPRAFRPDRPSGAHPTTSQTAPATSPLAAGIASFRRHLAARNLSPKTERTYLDAALLFEGFLVREGLPATLPAIHREHVEAFIADQLGRFTASTAHNRYRSLQAFFKWAVEEELIALSPMERMKPPIVGEHLSPMLDDDQLPALLRVCCADRTFAGRRDEAIIRVRLDSGARRAETAALCWTPGNPESNDLDLDARQLWVFGKGRRERIVLIGREAVRALDAIFVPATVGSGTASHSGRITPRTCPTCGSGPRAPSPSPGRPDDPRTWRGRGPWRSRSPPHVLPDVRPQDARRWDERDRPDDAGGLALADDGLAVRRVGGR